MGVRGLLGGVCVSVACFVEAFSSVAGKHCSSSSNSSSVEVKDAARTTRVCCPPTKVYVWGSDSISPQTLVDPGLLQAPPSPWTRPRLEVLARVFAKHGAKGSCDPN